MTKRHLLIILIGIIENAKTKAKQPTYPDGYDRAVWDTLTLLETECNSALDKEEL